MGGRALSIALGILLAAAVCVIIYLLVTRPERPSNDSGAPLRAGNADKPAAAARAASKPVPEVPAPSGLSDKELDAKYQAIRQPEKTNELATLAADAQAPGAKRIEAVENLAAAKVSSAVLFPLAVKFSEEKEPVFKSVAVEVTASLLERGEKVADEEKAAAILVAAAKPENNGSLRMAAARGLAKMKSKAAAEALVGLMSNEDRLARKFAVEGLTKLSGGDAFGFNYALKPGDQKESLGKWAAWAKAYAPEAK